MRSPLNRLYKHTMRLVLSFVYLLIGSGDGSTLIIWGRGRGRIKTKLQISACCDAREISSQLEKSGTSTCSGWAVPHILVLISISMLTYR